MTEISRINTNEIIAGNNDRTTFDANALQELATSINEHGLIQPITCRWIDEADLYQIVTGERRFRACTEILKWTEIDAIIIDATDAEASALMLAENVARQDLDPIDEALAYQSRMDTYGWTISEIADKAGVSPVRIRFRIKLLNLRPDLQKLVRDGQMQIGYAQILSDGNLDTNRQMIAVRRMRDNPHPTPAWFRKEVNALVEEQSQDSLFSLSAFTVQKGASVKVYEEPAHPATTTPPAAGSTLKEIISNQVTFWSIAAEAWDRLGKPFKRQECRAAAQALALTIAAF